MPYRIKTFLNKLGRKKLFFLIPFVIILCLTLLYGFGKKDLYELKTRVKADEYFGIEPTDNEVLSESLANLGLLDVNNPSAVISSMKQRVSVSRDGASGLTEISVVGASPKELARLANEITNVYVGEINSRMTQMRRGMLKEKERELKEYRKNLEKELSDAKRTLEDLEAEMEVIRSEEERALTSIASLKARLAEFELERSNLLRIYTTVHPDVMRIDSEMAALKDTISSIPTEPKGKLGLERELKEAQETYAALKEKWDETNLKKIEDMRNLTGGATVVSYAEVPSVPSDLMGRKFIFAKGLITAVLTGLLTMLGTLLLDTSILTEEEMLSLTRLPVLGEIPYAKARLLKGMKIRRKGRLILGYEDNPDIIKPYSLLYANIQSTGFNGQMGGKSILLTSSVPREGKSLTASNLALAIAKEGKRVILVDANLAKPSVHLLFGINTRMPGFTDVLNKGVALDTAIRDVTDMLLGSLGLVTAIKFKGLDKLKIITTGSPVSHSSALLESDRMNSVLSELKTRFDYVILDGPAVSANTDSLALAAKSDAAFMVYWAGRTPRSHLRGALLQLGKIRRGTASNTPVVKGVILNGCT